MQDVKSEPLRSITEPLGKSGLQGTDAKRVAAANRLYAVTLCLIVILAIRGSAVSVENPRNSCFWQIMDIFANEHRWVRDIWDSLIFNILQSCMYGSKFDKWTSIRATDGLYNDIRKERDGNHTHESWRPSIKHSKAHFPTTKQAEYPKELCNEMARCLAKLLVSHGSILPDTSLTANTPLTARHLRHHSRKPLPPLVAEYWLISDQPIAEQFQHFKQLSRLPPTMEKGGVVLLENNGDLKQQCAALENSFQYYLVQLSEQHAALIIDKVDKWFGVLRTPCKW